MEGVEQLGVETQTLELLNAAEVGKEKPRAT